MLSVRREYADKIRDGSKTIEIRKRFNPQLLACYAVIYVPGDGVLTDLLRIENIWLSTPQEILWQYSLEQMGITSADFSNYTRCIPECYAITVKKCAEWGDDIPLKRLGEVDGLWLDTPNAPQSYRYFTWQECARLDSILSKRWQFPHGYFHPVFLTPSQRQKNRKKYHKTRVLSAEMQTNLAKQS